MINSNPIIRINNPIHHGFHRNRSGKAQQPSHHRRVNGTGGVINNGMTAKPETITCISGTPNNNLAMPDLQPDQTAVAAIPTTKHPVCGNRHDVTREFPVPEEGGM